MERYGVQGFTVKYSEGEWVKYEDVEKLEAENARLMEAIQKALSVKYGHTNCVSGDMKDILKKVINDK